jgi:uncharacterized LabA/DUF88 family protein
LSKNVAIFVDVANLYYSARGQDVDVDYVALLKAATKGRDLVRAYAYSGLDPENENQRKFIDFLNKNGYKVVHKDIRKFGDGRVKANLDIELVVDLFRVKDRMDIAVIVSGDGDFAPAIRALQDVGIRCEVISFRPNTSSDLIAVADEFTDIMKIASIGREKAAKGMSAPPMPAKEVDPDFAFREASPAVAAAALAAIKGGSTRGGRGRGRTTNGHRAEAGEVRTEILEQPAMLSGGHHHDVAVVESPEHVEQHAENGHEDANGEAHRRRRRRGGRGRGRRGHAEGGEQETTAAGADEAVDEIGWQELDDISQLGDLTEERAYEFQDADPETLAELGLPLPEAAAPAAEDGAEPKPRTRRTRTKTVEQAEDPASEAPAADAAAKPRRRSRAASTEAETETEKPVRATRSRAPKAAPDTAEAGAATGADTPAPARRAARGRTQKAPATADSTAAATASEDGAETQGIWQRFRSARTTRS